MAWFWYRSKIRFWYRNFSTDFGIDFFIYNSRARLHFLYRKIFLLYSLARLQFFIQKKSLLLLAGNHFFSV